MPERDVACGNMAIAGFQRQAHAIGMRFFVLPLLLIAACAPPQRPPSAPSEAPVEAVQAAPITISGAWASPTPGGASVSAGYMTIAAGAAADRLIAVSSPRAASVEIHTMETVGGVMQMRRIETLDVPAGGAATLAQGGNHLMFIGVTSPFAEGETIPVELTFANAGSMSASLPVRRPGAGAHDGH